MAKKTIKFKIKSLVLKSGKKNKSTKRKPTRIRTSKSYKKKRREKGIFEL